MRPRAALKLTVEQRLGFEIALARELIAASYKQMQEDLHNHGKYNPSSMIELHESERVLCALERVSGKFYRDCLDAERAHNAECRERAKEKMSEALSDAARKGLKP